MTTTRLRPTRSSEFPPSLTPLRDVSTPFFIPALGLALLIHLLLILVPVPVLPKPRPLPETALEVLILHETAQADAPPPDAVRSLQNQAGESLYGDAALSSSVEQPPPTAELVASQAIEETRPERISDAPPAPAPSSPQAIPAQVTQALPGVTLSEDDPSVLTTQASPKPKRQPLPDALSPRQVPPDTARILASQGQEIAHMNASLEARAARDARRVRRKSISASTREFRYANYLGAWARKVERIGNLNYPQAAKEKRLYGNLILHVAVRSDGSVENIRLVRSSGVDELDQAAISIVELAAPYAAFPPDIAAETDVLDIIRTWQFMRGGTLGWER